MTIVIATVLGLAVMVLLPAPRRRSTVVGSPPGRSFTWARGLPTLLRRPRRRGDHHLRAIRWVDALVAELRAGRPPRTALVAASATSTSLCPRATGAARLGGDVAQALRDDAAESRQSILTQVAACWAVSETSGAGLVAALEQVVAGARADEEVRHEIEAQIAAPRATARLLAVLPLVGIALGTALGASPLTWLTGSAIGLAVLAAGLLGIAGGLIWTSRMVSALEREVSGDVMSRSRRRSASMRQTRPDERIGR